MNVRSNLRTRRPNSDLDVMLHNGSDELVQYAREIILIVVWALLASRCCGMLEAGLDVQRLSMPPPNAMHFGGTAIGRHQQHEHEAVVLSVSCMVNATSGSCEPWMQSCRQAHQTRQSHSETARYHHSTTHSSTTQNDWRASVCPIQHCIASLQPVLQR